MGPVHTRHALHCCLCSKPRYSVIFWSCLQSLLRMMFYSQAEEWGVYKGSTVGCCCSGFLQSWMSSSRPRLKQACLLELFGISLPLELMPTPPPHPFECSTLLIVDPTGEEEHLSTGTLTVVTDEDGKLCCLHKPGMCSHCSSKTLVGRRCAGQCSVGCLTV